MITMARVSTTTCDPVRLNRLLLNQSQRTPRDRRTGRGVAPSPYDPTDSGHQQRPNRRPEFGRWGFRRVHSGQFPSNRVSVETRAHLTVYGTANAPEVPADNDDWGVCRLAETAIVISSEI
jgi:hypothetical protein